jgi:uncharacterized membrane protein
MKAYITIFLSLVALDSVWLGFISKSFYQKHLGFIFGEKFVLWPAIIFYLLFAYGILFFVLTPALEMKSIGTALFRGAILGLVAYATYDLTNQATISKWPLVVTLVDIVWGMFVTSATSVIAYYLISKI